VSDIGKILVSFGIVMIVVGGLLLLFGKVPWLGRLPGDIHIERDNWSIHIPLATSILISIILTLLLSLFSRR